VAGSPETSPICRGTAVFSKKQESFRRKLAKIREFGASLQNSGDYPRIWSALQKTGQILQGFGVFFKR
jgi:hypothetical protein